MTSTKIYLFIADDHEVFIDGLSQLLSDIPEFQLVGTALNGKELLNKLVIQPVDVILMDMRMPEMSGFEATTKVKELYPNTKILMIRKKMI